MNTQTLHLPVLLPSGPECDRCITRLQDELGRIKGVEAAAVNNARTAINITYDPNVVTLSRIEAEAEQIGAAITAHIDHQTIELRDLDCPDCAATIEKAVGQMPGVLWVGANFAAGQMHVEFERSAVTLQEICQVAEGHGVRACPLNFKGEGGRRKEESGPLPPSFWREHRKLLTTVLAALLAVGAVIAGAMGEAKASPWLYAASILVGGWSTARGAWMAVRTRAVDMNVLMTLAVIGAAGIGDRFEGAAVVVLFNIGNLIQSYTVERTRRSIRALMDLSPKTARVRRGTSEIDVPVEEVRPEEIVLVRPGERIPMDGEIIAGASAINEAPVTGESVPADKGPGDYVFAGTLNGPGALEFRVTHVFRDTVLARIIHHVEEAQAQRAPTQQFIDRFARVYTPIVVGLAILIAVLPPLGQILWHITPAWKEWLLRALSLLIIACPCALVISTPVAIVTAIGTASRNGALIKGGAYLEQIGELRALLYDKTGTLTTGQFQVEDVLPLDSLSCNEILRLAAAIEAKSEHPLAAAFRSWVQGSGFSSNTEHLDVQAFQALPGQGVSAVVNGETYLLGNRSLLQTGRFDANGARSELERVESLGKTAVLLANRERPLGVIVLSDTPRRDIAPILRELETLGVEYQAMLTGDNPQVARAVAEAVGLRDYKASLLPEQKVALVKEFQRQYGSVGMVGDGINDAPALAAANVGFVMGAAGSDTAMETADVVLMSDDLTRLPYLIRLSRGARAVIRQNVGFSLITKVLLIGAAVTPALGLPLWLAVLGDVGVSLLVTLNALRLIDRRPALLPAGATQG